MKIGLCIGLVVALLSASLITLGPSPAAGVQAGDLSYRIYLPIVSRPTIHYPNCRLGVGVVNNGLGTYPLEPFHFGWYVNWNASGTSSYGMEHFATLRIRQNKDASGYLPTYLITPTLTMNPGGLGPLVLANPGHVWIIGNEIDRRGQDEALPEMYAQIYHAAYTFIKNLDPTAKLATGSIVQPTPLRLQYLDKVLTAYRTQFGTAMPIDIWNIHMYILPELVGSWGAEVPPGSSATSGRLYDVTDNINLAVFQSLLQEMRSWMKARGYQNTPLIISEYGALLPVWWLQSGNPNLTEADQFLFNRNATFYIESGRDSQLGYAPDNYRLAQRGAIYSLDDDRVDQFGDFYWGTLLFRSTPPYTMTAAGASFRDTIAAALPSKIDLFPYEMTIDPPTPLGISEPITVNVTVAVANSGNTLSMAGGVPLSTTISFTDVTSDSLPLGTVLVAPVNGCGGRQTASVTWPDLAMGKHRLRVQVDSAGVISETDEANNWRDFEILVGQYAIYLPTIAR